MYAKLGISYIYMPEKFGDHQLLHEREPDQDVLQVLEVHQHALKGQYEGLNQGQYKNNIN